MIYKKATGINPKRKKIENIKIKKSDLYLILLMKVSPLPSA